MPALLLIALYVGLVALPWGLALAQDLPPRPLRDEIATGLGMAALVVLQLEFLLSGRFRAVSGRVGMDVTMHLHQILARLVLAAVLLHPLLYGGARAMLDGAPADDPARLWLNYDWFGIWPGVAALLGLGAVVAMAIGRDTLGYRYEIWRLAHGLGAAAVAGLATLHALRAGRYSADPALTALWQGLFALALASLLWVYAVKPALQSRRPWEVSGLRRVARRTWELTLAPRGHDGLRYRAGQFAWLNFGHPPVSLAENPFSIASAPADGPELRFVIKELGDSTDRIGTTRPGTRAWIDGPFGSLVLDGHREAPGIACIAGGVGVAPMLAILRQMEATGDPRPRTLVYANRTEDQIACADTLDRMARETGLSVVHTLSEPPPGWQGATGFVTPELLGRHFGDPAHRDWLYVLCGPPPMLRSVRAALRGMGVPRRNILLERFVYD